MYRYFLFFCGAYYPYGGMEDCVFKTNDFEELEQFIHTNYEDDWYQGTFSYYDALEDRTCYANMEYYNNEEGFVRWRFLGWENNI